MSSPPSLETNERVSRRFFNLVLKLVEELETENDHEGLEVLPTVIVTTGVMTMCRSMTADTVGVVLDALKLKVERGDFTSGRDVSEEH
ncbi:MAG: hypothetical protein FWG97_05285 [Deltaproteobacteria bacterium]|nr:hypothetical protein [Deltaproteobacteria bacterium]